MKRGKRGKRGRRSRLRVGLIGIVVLVLIGLGVRVSTRRTPRRPMARTFTAGAPAKVLHVVDGDTAYFTLKDGRQVKGRLAGINTPECHKKQVRIGGGKQRSARCDRDDEFHGLAAYRELKRILAGGALRLDCERARGGRCKRGRHGRVLVTLTAGGRDVAELLVRAGAAFTYTKYPSRHRARLCAAEFVSRDKKRGVWAAGEVNEVMAMMSPRTRAWYARHDLRCRKAMKN